MAWAAAILQRSNALTNAYASVIPRATLYDTESQAADNVCCTASSKFCDWTLIQGRGALGGESIERFNRDYIEIASGPARCAGTITVLQCQPASRTRRHPAVHRNLWRAG